MVFVFLAAILSVSVTAAAPIRWSKELDKKAAKMTEGRTKLERMARVQSSLEKSAALWKLTSTQFPGDAQYVLELEAAAEEMNKLLSAQCVVKSVDEAGCNKHREDAREWLKEEIFPGIPKIAEADYGKMAIGLAFLDVRKKLQPNTETTASDGVTSVQQAEQLSPTTEAAEPNNPDNGQQ